MLTFLCVFTTSLELLGICFGTVGERLGNCFGTVSSELMGEAGGTVGELFRHVFDTFSDRCWELIKHTTSYYVVWAATLSAITRKRQNKRVDSLVKGLQVPI